MALKQTEVLKVQFLGLCMARTLAEAWEIVVSAVQRERPYSCALGSQEQRTQKILQGACWCS